jgi:DNA mismatch repair protein MutL
MADIIQLLPDSVANQIAAGEVIQRPASVVKELVENSVDAGSTSIKIYIKDGGRNLIQVIDNGCGMSDTDARIAFERHSTSKISNADDLFEIRTMGFRGEALASIAAVAKIRLKTRQSGNDIGTLIEISGSEIVSQSQEACPVGVNIIVKNLFFNVPARRKFLKSNSTELKHIINEFQKIAIAYPDIELFLSHNDSEIYNLPKSNIKQRIIHIYGKSINQNLTTINTDTSLVKLKGFIGKPEYAKKTFGEQFFFINNRFMRHPYFHRAVMNAYEKILQPDSIPSYFIFMEAEPGTIDINIHPTKTEIKFEDEQAIFQIIKAAVKEALGKFSITPSIDFNSEGVIEIPPLRKDTEISIPEIPVNPEYNPFETGKNPKSFPKEKKYISEKESRLRKDWEKLFAGFENRKDHPDSFTKDGMPEQKVMESSSLIPTNNIFQLKGRYILTSVKSGLMIIDQKRAHERILFEKYIRSLANNVPMTQKTLYPETVEMDAGDHSIIMEILEDICAIGFDISDFGNNTVIINGCPSDIRNPNPKELIELLIEHYKSTQEDIKLNAKENVARALAMASAINYGTRLTAEEMQVIVDQLFACEEPNYSPTGKKTMTIMSMDEFEKILK